MLWIPRRSDFPCFRELDDSSESPGTRCVQKRHARPGGEAGPVGSVLGYDFVRFAAALGLRDSVRDGAALNAALAAGLDMEWAGAPVVWDALGLAHRQLLLFQPARQGKIPVNREAFGAYYRRAEQNAGSLPTGASAQCRSRAGGPEKGGDAEGEPLTGGESVVEPAL